MKRSWIEIALAATVCASSTAGAQDWPSRPITMVVPYAAGGPTDAIGRLFAQQMSERLRSQIVVENIGGAGGMTGASRVAQAQPDGYHFLFTGSNMQIPAHRGHPFRRIADSVPVIADSW